MKSLTQMKITWQVQLDKSITKNMLRLMHRCSGLFLIETEHGKAQKMIQLKGFKTYSQKQYTAEVKEIGYACYMADELNSTQLTPDNCPVFLIQCEPPGGHKFVVGCLYLRAHKDRPSVKTYYEIIKQYIPDGMPRFFFLDPNSASLTVDRNIIMRRASPGRIGLEYITNLLKAIGGEPVKGMLPLDLVAASDNIKMTNKKVDIEYGKNSDIHRMTMVNVFVESANATIHIPYDKYNYRVKSISGVQCTVHKVPNCDKPTETPTKQEKVSAIPEKLLGVTFYYLENAMVAKNTGKIKVLEYEENVNGNKN